MKMEEPQAPGMTPPDAAPANPLDGGSSAPIPEQAAKPSGAAPLKLKLVKPTSPSPDPAAAEAAGELPPSEEDLVKLKAQAAKAQEHWEMLLRTASDLENFKKRAARERQDAIKYAN